MADTAPLAGDELIAACAERIKLRAQKVRTYDVRRDEIVRETMQNEWREQQCVQLKGEIAGLDAELAAMRKALAEGGTYPAADVGVQSAGPSTEPRPGE